MVADDSPGFADYLATIKRRRTLMVIVGLPAVLIGAVLATALPDVYRASTMIDIEEDSMPGVQADEGGEGGFAEQYVDSITNTVQSRENLLEIAEKFKPYPDLELDEAATALREDIAVDMVIETVLDPGNGRQREVITAFTVSYFSREADVAQKVADWLGKAYVAADRANRQGRAVSAADFYGQEAERLRAEIGELENKLADFKQRNYGRLPELTGVNMNALDRTERDLESTQLQINTLRRDRIFLAQQLQDASSTNTEAGLLQQLEQEYKRKSASYAENHPDMIAMRRQIESLKLGGPTATGNSLQAQLDTQKAILDQARQRYSNDHPDIRRLTRTIEALESRIAAGEKSAPVSTGTAVTVQLQTQINAIDTQLAAMEARSSELRAKLLEVEGRIESTPEVEREYQTLTRDMNLAREKYEQLLGHQMDAEVSQSAISGGKADEFRILQAPTKPRTPAKPARLMILIVGIAVAGVFAVTVALGAEILDSRVRGSRDVRKALSISPLAIVPMIQNSVTLRHRTLKLVAIAGLALVCTPLFYIAVRIWA